MASLDANDRAIGLEHLPHSVICRICEYLNDGAEGSAGLRSCVALAFSCPALLEAVGAAEHLWRAHCERMGWSLAWLAALPADCAPSAWRYFCRRMVVRHRLRRRLRTLARFMGPVCAKYLRPSLGVQRLREAEAALQAPLPWELFELYRWHDGQDPASHAWRPAQLLHAGRLLPLGEALQAALHRHSPRDTAAAFAAASTTRGAGGADPSSGEGPDPPDVLLPISEQGGGAVVSVDWGGRVWLSRGFNTWLLAPSLAAYIQQVLF